MIQSVLIFFLISFCTLANMLVSSVKQRILEENSFKNSYCHLYIIVTFYIFFLPIIIWYSVTFSTPAD